MKQVVANLVNDALKTLPELSEVAAELDIASTVERTRDASHGDFACNVAMRLAKPARKNPREIATSLVEALGDNEQVAKVEIAGPGFINFHLSPAAFHAELKTILDAGSEYGRQAKKEHPRILLEFISANPTGPMHVGHGRHAAYGASVGNLLEAAGFPVHREYYVNDAGRQMDILGASVWLRWLDSNDISVPFPKGGYRGEYIRDIAAQIETASLIPPNCDDVLSGLPSDAPDGDADVFIDALVARAKTLQGEKGFDHIRQQALESIRADIEEDLAEFGVTFDLWYSEQSLTKTGRIDDALAVLQERGMLYEKDGATWFLATKFGDEKDRVVIRANGVKTYFASDIAYHFDKRERGFDHLINILGQDHHGYIERLQAGEFDTLRKLRAEVGNDASRFYYIMRSNDQHLDFDLDIATSQSSDNPVYYIQYAHARIARVFRKANESGMNWNRDNGVANLSRLTAAQETSLMSAMSRYPEIIELAAKNRAPQTLAHYLRDLVSDFHSSYNAHKVLSDDAGLRDARLTLYSAVKIVVANGLAILGVSAPEEM